MRLKAKTTMKINFLVKMIMIVLFVLGAFVFFVDISKAAESEWKNNPAECSTKLGAVECPTGYKICGVFNDSGLCFIPMTRERLSSTNDGLSQTRYSPSFGGGFILDCNATVTQTKGETEPHCNNSSVVGVNTLWCNASSTCLTSKRVQTRCFAGIWEGQSGSHECIVPGMTPTTTGCVSGYANCNLGEPNSPIDPSDCEVRIGVTTCTGAGGLQGTYNASCQCVVATSTFVTGVQTHFATSSPLLWGTQYGDGDLLRLSKNDISTSTFTISNSGQVGIGLTSISNDVAFEVSSTDRGVLLSRLTTAQRDGISDPSDGLLIYNINTYQFEYFNGTNWRSIDTTSTYSALSNGGLSLNSNNEFSVNFDELTLTTSSGKLAINYDSDIFKTNALEGLSLKYDGDFFSIDSITGLMFKYDPDFFASSTDGMRLVEMGNVVSSTYGNSTTAVTLSIDNYGRITFVGTSTIMVDINNIINSSSLARVDIENTFASPTIFSASTTFNATTTHNAGVRANLYCDASGTNCFDLNMRSWPQLSSYVTTTPITFQGGFVTGTTILGYQAGNQICRDYFGNDYHICSFEDIHYIIRTQNINFMVDAAEGWVSNGPPGYVANSNDCNGWTTSSSLYYGAYWIFNKNGGGIGRLTGCNLLRPISCCK